MFEYTGVDGIMIGRGVFGNPWIFKRIINFLKTGEKLPEISNQEKLRVIKKHIGLELQEKEEITAIREMRKHISWYTKNMPNSSEFRNDINKIENKEELIKKVEEFLSGSKGTGEIDPLRNGSISPVPFDQKEKFMKEALKEAKKAYDKLEVPVGAVIVKDGKVIARAHNLKETKFDTTKHAEILAIQKASKKLNSWRLLDCEMYVTLEPCSMCAGALINSRIKKVFVGTDDEKTGAIGSVFNLLDDYSFNHTVEFEKGILKDECENILKEFFKNLREMKKGSI